MNLQSISHYDKSNLLGINIWPEEISKLANELGCSVGEWPIQYLGPPLGGNPRSKIF